MAREDVARKRRYVKKDKKTRRNRKGWMDGMREETMLVYVPAFAQAIDSGWQAAEVSLKHILNVYHFHFPYTLPDDEEPSVIEEYDVKKAAAANDESKLSLEEVTKKRTIVNEQNKSIRRWLVYWAKAYRKRFRKLTKRNANDTFEIFMARLCGITKAPKQPHAVFMFQREKKDVVGAAVASAWAAQPNKKTEKPPVTFYDKISREMMKKLSSEDNEKYKTMAVEEGNKEKAEYKRQLTEPPSKTPEDRAAAVAKLKGFLGDIQRGCEQRTFLHIFSLVGGPMSETGGEFNTFNVMVSKSNAEVPLTFPEFWGDDKMTELVNVFKDYLVTCYSSEDKKSVIVGTSTTAGAATSTAQGATSLPSTSAATVPGEPTSEAAQIMDIDSAEGLRSLLSIYSSDEESSSDDSDSDGSDDEKGDDVDDEEEGSKKRKHEEKIQKGKAVKRHKNGGTEKDDNEKGKGKENTPAQPKEPRRSNYEIERDHLIRQREVVLISLNDYHAKGLATEGVEWQGYVAHGLELIASGQAKDPALASAAPPAKPRPKPRQKTAQSATMPKRTLRSSGMASVGGSVNAPTGTLGTGTSIEPAPGEGLPNEEGGGMGEGVMSAEEAENSATGQKDVTERQSHEKDAIVPNSGRNKAGELAQDFVPMPGKPGNHTSPSPEATNDLTKVKINMLTTDAPPWLQDAVNEFIEAEGSQEMLPLLLLLLEIEREHGWTTVEKGKTCNLPGKRMRPLILTTWINNGRTRTGKRVVLAGAEVGKLPTAWRSWWAELQEPWRIREEDGRWKRGEYGDEWRKLVVPGQNGILSIVAVLSWWTSFCHTAESAMEEQSVKVCVEARTDVEWVMKGLLAKLEHERRVKNA
ncbi:hypothetical protein BDZ89DRAFT_1050947 [Hymenopellis radicata]|nr:hypothetical protein BDZ89DRAFT_1050947 [Hymenopellis radicata]